MHRFSSVCILYTSSQTVPASKLGQQTTVHAGMHAGMHAPDTGEQHLGRGRAALWLRSETKEVHDGLGLLLVAKLAGFC